MNTSNNILPDPSARSRRIDSTPPDEKTARDKAALLASMPVHELAAELEKRKLEDRPNALRRIEELQKEISKNHLELLALAELYGLDASFTTDSDWYMSADRSAGWDSSSARC
jgi:hypothetical protein